ncbi:MAG: hypothetical protein MI922_14305, partial [Bacteroidales bacterium]|nr:hypothetical protein [Bacteroidales bacterium]
LIIIFFSTVVRAGERLYYSAEFEVEGNFQFWQIVDGAQNVSVSNGVLSANTTSIDPKVRIANLSLPWNWVGRVEYRIRQKSKPSSSNWNNPLLTTGIGFGIAGHPDEGAHGWLGNSYNTISYDGEGWFLVNIDMDAVIAARGWTSPPGDQDNDGFWDSIRIDPIGNDSSAYFEIDYVRIYGEDNQQDLHSDSWVATDDIGRELPGYDQVGPTRDDRTVAMFYFLWLGQHSTTGPWDITKLLAENPNDPEWGPHHHFHHWGESEIGYYVSDDPYVIRRHASMLSDAGVDVIFFDVTNAVTYKSVYEKLCHIYMEIRGKGGQTPQIAFITHSNSVNTVQRLYNDLYS